MPLLDGTLCRPAVLELSAHRRILPFSPSIHRSNCFCCNAKISADDDEQKHESSHRGFSIRVPTIPKLGDIESARRMLESAFHALSFEMPRIPIESALQGLTFDIFKLPIPKQGLILDITGFVATKLRKPSKHAEDVAAPDDAFYPRCAWPRTLKEAHSSTENPENLQDPEVYANLALEQSTSAFPQLHTLHASPKEYLSSNVELGERPSVPSSSTGKNFLAPLGPHCAWPRKTHQVFHADRASSAQSISSNVLYPRSAWPRNSLSCDGVVLNSQQSTVESNMGSVAKEEELSPCISETQGGPRCAWPRKILSASQSYDADETTPTLSGDLYADGSRRGKGAEDGKVASAISDGAAELPRRLLATSVGLSVMNQLTKGSVVASLFDFCSSLPAGNLEFAEEEDVALDLGRRTLLVFIKHSSG